MQDTDTCIAARIWHALAKHCAGTWKASLYANLLLLQVHADFEYIGQAAGLNTVCLYGGTPYAPQENILRKGVDIVVGTPGRVKDHIERGSLKLTQLRFR